MDPDRCHGGDSADSRRAVGTVIHHAAARAIGPLVVAMIEASFRTLLVAAARRLHTSTPGLAPTRRRTVDVTTIAGGTNAKGPSTRPARAHTKDRLHEAAAQSARPRRSTATSCRMTATDSACRSVESVTRAWRVATPGPHAPPAHLISKPHSDRRPHGIPPVGITVAVSLSSFVSIRLDCGVVQFW